MGAGENTIKNLIYTVFGVYLVIVFITSVVIIMNR
jgi:hypothetical protein